MMFESLAGGRQVVAEFNGGTISSDGGALLLQETDQRLRLLERLSHCFLDGREQTRVQHGVSEMVRQRVYGLALGYEDLNDHDSLREDPLLQTLAGKREPGTDRLAGKSTLNRLERGTGQPDRYKRITFWRDGLGELLGELFLEAHTEAPQQIVLETP